MRCHCHSFDAPLIFLFSMFFKRKRWTELAFYLDPFIVTQPFLIRVFYTPRPMRTKILPLCIRCRPVLKVQCSCESTLAALKEEQAQVISPEELSLPLSADVVVCGEGLAGLSTAYHLVKHGVNDVLLLEQSRIGTGSSSLSAGLMSGHAVWQQPQVQRIAEYSVQFCKNLSQSYQDLNFKLAQTIHVARNAISFQNLQRLNAFATAKGVKSRIIDPKTIGQICPALTTDGLLGGVLFPDDAKINPARLLHAIALEAQRMGVKIQDNCLVDAVEVNAKGEVTSVHTEHGKVKCKRFVHAGGMWSKKVRIVGPGSLLVPKVRLPAHPCLQAYMITQLPDNIKDSTPTVHDIDNNVFMTTMQTAAGLRLAFGGYDPEASVAFEEKTIPTAKEAAEGLPEDWDTFLPILQKLAQLFPSAKQARVDQLVSMGENYTPDGYLLIGELSKLRNFYVIGGMSGLGTTLAIGAADVLAQWIRRGEPMERVVSRIDLNRFVDLHTNKHYLRQRVPEVVSYSWKLLLQSHQFATARNLRASPIYQQQKQAGAIFGELSGYERPLYFLKGSQGTEAKSSPHRSAIGKPVWFDAVAAEYQACRERVGLMDMSSFSKFDVFSSSQDESTEVVKFLQYLCSGNIDVPVGETVYTGMQNEMGGYISDCTVSRLKQNHYFLIAPTIQQIRLRMWLERHLPEASAIVIQDTTSMYTAMNVVGPASRQLMQDLTDQSMTATDFPSFRCKEINVGFASGIRAVSVTHTGELGWVLYVPNEFAQHVYQQLVERGSLLGLEHAGYYCLRNLRMEKFFVYWGQDIDATTTPLECGRAFRVSFNKGDFIGRNALLKQRKEGVKRRYVQLVIDSHNIHEDPWPQGMEPIYRNGIFVGRTTTAGFGFTLGCQVLLGYVDNLDQKTKERDFVTTEWILDKDAVYETDIAGKRFSAKLNLHSPHLPMMSSEHPTHFRPTQ